MRRQVSDMRVRKNCVCDMVTRGVEEKEEEVVVGVVKIGGMWLLKKQRRRRGSVVERKKRMMEGTDVRLIVNIGKRMTGPG